MLDAAAIDYRPACQRPLRPVISSRLQNVVKRVLVNSPSLTLFRMERRLARTPKQRASRKAPAAVVGQVQAWADAALIGRPGGSAAATDAHAAFVADTGSDLSQAAFGTAMAEIGFMKAKRGGKVLYTGVALKQAVRLASAN